jgi:hypothetical protein
VPRHPTDFEGFEGTPSECRLSDTALVLHELGEDGKDELAI